MKKSSNIKHLRELVEFLILLTIVFVFSLNSCGQATSFDPLNNPIGANNFLGWDNTVNSNLDIRHNEPGQPIIFRIAGNEWMRFTEGGALAVNTPTNNALRPIDHSVHI